MAITKAPAGVLKPPAARMGKPVAATAKKQPVPGISPLSGGAKPIKPSPLGAMGKAVPRPTGIAGGSKPVAKGIPNPAAIAGGAKPRAKKLV